MASFGYIDDQGSQSLQSPTGGNRDDIVIPMMGSTGDDKKQLGNNTDLERSRNDSLRPRRELKFTERFDERGRKNDNTIQDLKDMHSADGKMEAEEAQTAHMSVPLATQTSVDDTANGARLGFMNRLNPLHLRRMSLNYIFRWGYLIVFVMLILFSIITLSDSAFLVSKFNSSGNYSNLGERDRVRFILFNSAWTLVTAIIYVALFLIPPVRRCLTGVTAVVVQLIYLFITWALWMIAASTIVATLGGRLNCGPQSAFVYCGQLTALEAFSWMIWAVITIGIFQVVLRSTLEAKHGKAFVGTPKDINIMFGTLILFNIITLSLSGFLVHQFHALHNYANSSERDRARFILFASAWTLFTASCEWLAYSDIFHKVEPMALRSPNAASGLMAQRLAYMFITWVLWIVAARTITDTLGGGRGLNCWEQTTFVYCGQLNALEAFSWMVWIMLTIAIFLVVLRTILGIKRGEVGSFIHE